MSLQRRIPMAEPCRRRPLRWDVFNLFDRANFGNPNGDESHHATRSGTISSLAGDPRVMQFSIRVQF